MSIRPRATHLRMTVSFLLVPVCAGCGNAVDPIEVEPVEKTDNCLISPSRLSVSFGENETANIDFIARSTCNQLGGLMVNRIDGLRDMRFATGIVWIGDLEVVYNQHLESLAGLESVEEIAELTVNNNNSLASFEGLSGLKTIGGDMYGEREGILYISGNASLESLDGLENVNSVNSIKIAGNENLRSVEALHGVEGLESLTVLNNINLPRCRIEAWIDSLPTPPEDVDLQYNGSGDCE